MDYCCHICAGAASFFLSKLDSVQKRLSGPVGDVLFSILWPFPTDATLQAYHYWIIISMESVQKNYASQFNQFKHLHLLCTRGQNYLNSLCISLVRRRFHWNIFFPRAAELWNRHPSGYFSDHYNLNLFKFRFLILCLTFGRHLSLYFYSKYRLWQKYLPHFKLSFVACEVRQVVLLPYHFVRYHQLPWWLILAVWLFTHSSCKDTFVLELSDRVVRKIWHSYNGCSSTAKMRLGKSEGCDDICYDS